MPTEFKIDICNDFANDSLRSLDQITKYGLRSYNNIGDPDERGLPAPLQHQIKLTETSNDAPDECIKKIDINNVFDTLKQQHPNIEMRDEVVNDKHHLMFDQRCDDEDACGFAIHPSTFFPSVTEQMPDDRTFTDRIATENRVEMGNTSIDPTDIQQLTYFTMKKKFPDYGLKFRNISMPQWKNTFYPRLETWKDRPEFPNVSLAAKIFVESPSLHPRNINSYGMEVECEGFACGLDFYRNSHPDGGPNEIKTSGYADPKELFKELAGYHFVQHGQAEHNGCNCGSHFHVAPQDYERTYYRTYRGLMGYFAPFFAGTIDRMPDSDFRFRRGIGGWAAVPPLYNDQTLRTMDGSKAYYVHPHPPEGNKPFTFEFRVNEAVAPSTVTGINIMSRIADAFVDTRTVPRWSNELLEMDRAAIERNELHQIDRLNTVLTNDRKTADIMSLVLQKEIEPGQTVSLLEILDASKKTMPMNDYEIAWVDRIQRGETWSKMLRDAGSQTNQMLLTRKTLREFLPINVQQAFARDDHTNLLGDFSESDDEYDICDSDDYNCDECDTDEVSYDDDYEEYCDQCC